MVPLAAVVVENTEARSCDAEAGAVRSLVVGTLKVNEWMVDAG